MLPEKDKRFCAVPGTDLSLNTESGIYYATKQFRHLRIPMLFKTTKETDIRKAKKRLPQLIKEHLDVHQEGRRREGRGRLVEDVIAEIQRTESPGLRSGTQENRTMYFEELGKELGHLPIDRLSLSIWTRWLEDFRKRKARKTFWDYAKHMNILIRYAYEQKYVSHLITFPNPDPKKATGTVLSPQNIRELWAVMNDDTRDQLVLAYENCMRLREVLYLTWDRVDLETGEITLRPEDVKTGSKTGKGRTFFVSEQALERLRERRRRQLAGESGMSAAAWRALITTTVPTGMKDSDVVSERIRSAAKWVFPSPTGNGPVEWNATAWKRAKAKALKANPAFPHWARWHDLRHSSLSHLLLDKKMNPLLVAEFAGVSMQTIQRVYLHSTAEKTKSISRAISIREEE